MCSSSVQQVFIENLVNRSIRPHPILVSAQAESSPRWVVVNTNANGPSPLVKGGDVRQLPANAAD
jgi:hypothetical protein